jgi:excisionase family DNA binding protein
MENAIDLNGYIERPLPVLGAEVPIGVCAVRAIDHIRGVAADLTDGPATFAECCSERLFHAGMSHLVTAQYEALRPVLSVNEAARVLGIERATLYRLLRAGELESVRVGQRQKFRPEDLDAYLERGRAKASP